MEAPVPPSLVCPYIHCVNSQEKGSRGGGGACRGGKPCCPASFHLFLPPSGKLLCVRVAGGEKNLGQGGEVAERVCPSFGLPTTYNLVLLFMYLSHPYIHSGVQYLEPTVGKIRGLLLTRGGTGRSEDRWAGRGESWSNLPVDRGEKR